MKVVEYSLPNYWFIDFHNTVRSKAHVNKALSISAQKYCKYFTFMGTDLLNKLHKIGLLGYSFIPFKISLAHKIGALIS